MGSISSPAGRVGGSLLAAKTFFKKATEKKALTVQNYFNALTIHYRLEVMSTPSYKCRFLRTLGTK